MISVALAIAAQLAVPSNLEKGDNTVCVAGPPTTLFPSCITAADMRPSRIVVIMIIFEGIDGTGTGHAAIQPTEFFDMESCGRVEAAMRAAKVSALCMVTVAALK